MSERLKCTSGLISNEEIVEDLTQNLQSSLVMDDFVINPGSSNDDSLSSQQPPNDTAVNASKGSDDLDLDKNYDEKYNVNNDTDSIDEEYLKSAEVDLTDDQKAERQLIADELKQVGNNDFKAGDYERSLEKYTEALSICPLQFIQQRSILYCNRGAARMKLQQYEKAIKDCSKSIELDDKYIKAYIRRAQSYKSTEKFDESLADYKKILELDPSNKEAQAAQIRLPPLIEEKNEKLKTEMLSKLKDLGNMILKPFGLSTANFQMEQDPESKGYKINFKQ